MAKEQSNRTRLSEETMRRDFAQMKKNLAANNTAAAKAERDYQSFRSHVLKSEAKARRMKFALTTFGVIWSIVSIWIVVGLGFSAGAWVFAGIWTVVSSYLFYIFGIETILGH